MRSPSGVRIVLASVAVCAALALSLVVRHGANGATPHARQPETAQAAADRVSPSPPGFTNFQMRYPAEVRDGPAAFATGPQVERAQKANDEINRRIIWRETRLWSIELGPRAYGDCVQYALTKRHVLRQEGVPDGAFRLAVVYAAKYHGLHMILEMRTPTDIYVLDSLENDARRHFYTVAQMSPSYSIVKYQEWGKPRQWMAPSALVAESTRAMRRLHDEVQVAGNDAWVYSARERDLRLHPASREPWR
ncbi:MAG TPA: transglutaminase-like cysteine peptidase [Rhizomicrobium sp.]|nr:transglutaminase-like cysteine peptidase [Rhizomicrobium sp.]